MARSLGLFADFKRPSLRPAAVQRKPSFILTYLDYRIRPSPDIRLYPATGCLWQLADRQISSVNLHEVPIPDSHNLVDLTFSQTD